MIRALTRAGRIGRGFRLNTFRPRLRCLLPGKKVPDGPARGAQLEAEQADTIAKWIAGDADCFVSSRIDRVYLRARYLDIDGRAVKAGDAKTWTRQLQTSKGALIPLDEAHKAYRFVRLHRAKGWHRNGDVLKVGDYQLDAVNDQGVVAGCHRIEWSEIERFAATQGWK